MPKFEISKRDLKSQIPEDAIRAAKEISKISGVSAVYLFGSYAKGTQRPYSDVDLCAITDAINNKRRGEILIQSSKKIETHIMADMPLNIQFRVFQEGEPLFINSNEKVLDTRLRVMKAYQDFRPRLEKYWRRALA